MKIKVTYTLGIISLLYSCQPNQDTNPQTHEIIKNSTTEPKDTIAQSYEISDNKKMYNDTIELLKIVELIQIEAKSKNISAFNDYIHPQYGCYFVSRPGSYLFYDRINHFTYDWQKLDFDINNLFSTVISSTIEFEEWPDYVDCGYDGFSKDGAFAKEVDGYKYISNLATFNQKEFDTQETKEELDNIQNIENLVKFSVIWTNPSLIIDFFKFENKWYIGVINKGRFDCAG